MPLASLHSFSLPSLDTQFAKLPSLGGKQLGIGPTVPVKALKPLGAYQSEEEESLAGRMLQGGMSALAYLGSQFDAILGRRVRAGISLAQGNQRPGVVSELFTVPVLSDLFGWTDRTQTVTGKEITGWDDDKRYLDDAAAIAVEVVTDPTSFMTGGATGLFGTSTKAGRLVAKAGVGDEIARGLTKKLGRRVGRREALARTSLREINIPDLAHDAFARADLEERLDKAAQGYGFDSFKAAQEAEIGGQKLSAAWGFVKVPMKGTPDKIIHGGDRFVAAQRKLDELGNWFREGEGFATKHPLLRTWEKLFDKDTREASNYVSQQETKRLSEETRRRHFQRAKVYSRLALSARQLGIDNPKFQSDIWAAAEKQFTRKRAASTETFAQGQMWLHPDDRDAYAIVQELFPVTNQQRRWRPLGREVKRGEYAVLKTDMAAEPKLVEEVKGNYVRFQGGRDYVEISRTEAMLGEEYIPSKYSQHGFTAAQIGKIRDWVYDYAKEQAADNWDQLQRANSLNIGTDVLKDYMSAYASRFARNIESTIGRKVEAPQYVTPFMRRELKRRFGMSDVDINAAETVQMEKYGDVRDLHAKVFEGQDKIDAAFKEVQDSEKKLGRTTRPGGAGYNEDILETSDATHRRRVDIFRNLPGSADVPGGLTAANALVMDQRLSSRMAGIYEQVNGEWVFRKTTAAERHQIIYKEFFHGHKEALDYYDQLRDGKKLRVGIPYGPMAEVVGAKPAALIRDADELAALKEAMYAEKHASEKSYDLMRELAEVSPLHVLEQKPLFPDDPLSGHLAARQGAEEAIQAAAATLRLLGRTARQNLTKGQGHSLLDALEKASVGLSDKQGVHRGTHARPAEALANFLRYNQEEGVRETWNIFGTEMSSEEIVKYLGERPKLDPQSLGEAHVHQQVAGDYKTARRLTRLKAQAQADEFEDMRSKILISFGLRPANASSKSGYEKLVSSRYKSLKAAADAHGEAYDARRLLEQAKAEAAAEMDFAPTSRVKKVYDRNYNKFLDEGHTPYAVPMDEFNDARNSMSLAKSPGLIQDVVNFADKFMNSTKAHWTTSWIPFLARNFQTLGWMDLFANAENVLDPREWRKMARRWKDSYDFHAGRPIRDIHKLPLFSDHKWSYIENPAWKKGGPTSVPRRILPNGAMKDRILTDRLRAEFAAANVAPASGVGELLQDKNLATSAMAVIDTLPGVGENVQSFGKGLEATKSGTAQLFKGLVALRHGFRRAREEGLDMQWFNPLNVRGGFFDHKKSNKRRSGFLPLRVGENVSSYSESLGRTATWLGQLYKGVDPLTAAARSNAAHVDYDSLSNFERQVMRRVVPFYTYQRKMIPYLMRTMFKHPGGPLTNMVRAVSVASAEREGRFTPQQLQGALAVPLYDDATGKVRAYLKPDLPVSILNNMFSIGGSAYETFQNTTLGWLSQSHFILKGGLELAFGKSTFQKGRDLEDMYSRIGVKDPILNQIVMTSPLGRYVTNFGPGGSMFDERKSLGERAFSFATGQPIAHIDMDKATEEALDRALNKALSLEEGVGSTEKFYAYDPEALSDRSKALMRLRTTRDVRRLNAGKAKSERASPSAGRGSN